MAIKELDYFYDGSIRRFLEQVVRAFSGFQYSTGTNPDGTPQLVMVPCTMAQTSGLVAAITQNGSSNTLLTAPMIAIYITGLAGRRADVLNQNWIDKRQVTEREFVNGAYTGKQGNSYTVERLMPNPFELSINVDLWTSNLDQKLQLMQQFGTIFYPDISIQNSDNALDWTALTIMRVEDIIWSSKTIPVGTSTAIDIATLQLKLPIWLSAPAKVKSQRVIQQVVANIYDSSITEVESSENFMKRDIITPGNHAISVNNNIIKLLGSKTSDVEHPELVPFKWLDLVTLYGVLRPTLSTIRLKNNPDIDDWATDIVGTIQYNPSDPSELLWTLDASTLPANTQSAINALIDPTKTFPGVQLPIAASGQRYLINKAIVGPTVAWGTLVANANDIIQYDGSLWHVVHTPTVGDSYTPDYFVNSYTGNQFKWNGTEYVLSIFGLYLAGYWRIRL